jgi:7,8-dihydro-6-hydroxymethylpterin-pyrophosphokinase
LACLKDIEEELGRDFGEIRNGPRVIDLDILFYENLSFTSETLTIPHALMQERLFVLQPLAEYFIYDFKILQLVLPVITNILIYIAMYKSCLIYD